MKTPLPCVIAPLLLATALFTSSARAATEEALTILERAGVTGGLVVCVGTDDGLAGQFRSQPGVLVDTVPDGARLPFADNVVRLLVLGEVNQLSRPEIERVLCPGGVAYSLHPSSLIPHPFEKPWPGDIDSWPQFMYDGSGNPVNKDMQAGPPRSLRWRSGPLYQRSHNWDIGLAAMVSDGGRLLSFVDQGPAGVHDPSHPEDWRLIARDAFSGVKLWERPLVEWGSRYWIEPTSFTFTWATPFSLNRRLLVLGDRAYATLKYRADAISVLDAATGETIQEIKFDATPDEFIHDNGKLYVRLRQLPEPFTGKKFPADPTLKSKTKGGDDDQRPKVALDWMKSLPEEEIAAVDATSGEILWRTPARFVLVETLAATGDKVFYRDFDHVVALDAATGKEIWRAPCEARYSGSFGRGHAGGLTVYDNKVFCNSTTGLVGFDAASGAELWRSSGFWPQYAYFAPVSIRGAQGLIWHRQGTGYDPATGEPKRKLDLGDLLTGKSRCYRQVGAGRYFFDSYWGIQSVDMKGDAHSADPWLRGMCSYGFIPANGLLYVPQEPCNCFMGIKLDGFNTLASTIPGADYEGKEFATRLVKGPAFGREPSEDSSAAAPPTDSWPVYRADPSRSALAPAPLSSDLREAWKTELGGDLTSPTIVGDRVFVACKETGLVFCLNASDGSIRWQFAAGGGLNTPPTLHGNHAYFGSADGWVYCLDASNGELVWKFRAAPGSERIVSLERLESIWPCDGSLLIKDGTLLCAAGRSSYLDGGIFVYALDLKSGEVRQYARLDGPWPTAEELRKPPKNPMTELLGFSRDLFVLDDGKAFMNLARFDEALQPEELPFTPEPDAKHPGRRVMGRHLMATGGFTNDSLFHRVGMHYADSWPGFNNVHGGPNAGTFVCFDAQHGFSVKHYNHSSRYPDHIPGSGNFVSKDPLDAPSTAEGTRLSRKTKPLWETNIPIIAQAMLAAPARPGGEAATLFVAGLPDTNDPQDPLAPYLGRGTPKLIALSAADGQILHETDLPGAPVFDGMASADGSLFVSMTGGRIARLDPTK